MNAGVVAALTSSGVASVDETGSLQASLVLRLPFFESTASVREHGTEDHVFFDGMLPPGVGRATLTRQGALSIGALREQQLGIQAVDAAFVVRCDDDGFALLTQCRAELLALVQNGLPSSHVEIVVEESMVRITWPGAALEALPAFWERLVSIRAGA